MKKKVVIIGCGFGGFYAARFLSKLKKEIELTVIDKKGTFDFLPMLPDIIGRRINPQLLTNSIEGLRRELGFNFVKEEVLSLDLENNSLQTALTKIAFDYLLIASGSETNFYGNDLIRDYAYRIDSVEDVSKVLQSLEKNPKDFYLISGGGYTGIEVATNLSRLLKRKSIEREIIVVEKASSILGPLPLWMKDYVTKNLERLNIRVLTDTSIKNFENSSIALTNGLVFDNAMLFWAAGVKTAGYIQQLKSEKNPQGRLKVDKYLRLNQNCFAVGDSVYVSYKDSFLRMAVQFAIYQGFCAARNIANSIRGRQLKPYQPVDMGYIIPMANNRSCGQVLGLNIKGIMPTVMHFFMCIYRLHGFKNKMGLIKALLKGGW